METVSKIWVSFKDIFVEEGGLFGVIDTWYTYILLFIVMLGILTAFMSMMGGTRAFGEWMIKRVKTRIGAQLATAILGVVVFIDDYFNTLAVGQIARPSTDRHKISRAKLAYIIDSTSAPVCVVAPVSSWGAYIIATIGTILATHSVTEYSALSGFMQMIPMNYYVWAALGTVFVIALRDVDFGPMKKHEQRAIQTGEVMSSNQDENTSVENKLPTSNHGKVKDLIIPIAVLFFGTIAAMTWTGYSATVEAGDPVTAINMFGNANVTSSLLYGGMAAVIVAMILFIMQGSKTNELSWKNFGLGIVEGFKAMIPALSILTVAWMIVTLIGELQTGEYLAGLVQQSNLSVSLLPAILFILAGFIAFATGTSWGSFGILLPIAGQIAAATDISMILPMMAAVLAGSVFGDHCSPISDTTILSSTGAACDHIDHVTTQIPYALTSAGIAFVGYVLLGLTGSTWIGLAFVAVALVALFYLMKKESSAKQKEEAAV